MFRRKPEKRSLRLRTRLVIVLALIGGGYLLLRPDPEPAPSPQPAASPKAGPAPAPRTPPAPPPIRLAPRKAEEEAAPFEPLAGVKGGTLYHRPDCPLIKYSKALVRWPSQRAALDAGRTRCKMCITNPTPAALAAERRLKEVRRAREEAKRRAGKPPAQARPPKTAGAGLPAPRETGNKPVDNLVRGGQQLKKLADDIVEATKPFRGTAQELLDAAIRGKKKETQPQEKQP